MTLEEFVQQHREDFLRCWPWLERAIQRYGDTHTQEGVWARIADGRAQLWTAPKAAVLTSVETYDTGLKEVRLWLAGGDMDEAKVLHETIETWGRSLGCHRMIISGRRGWLRALPGFREVATTVVKDLP